MAAARLLLPRSCKTLNRLLNLSSNHSFFSSFRSLCPVTSNLQTFSQNESNQKKVIKERNPRSFSSEAVSAALDLDTRVPATIITGFLGSGKTTLLNHILTSEHGKRIAVIENEFGEVDIDTSLVASHGTSSDDIVMVNNGCLCCTVRGDLVKMLLELVKKKRDKFDHIVIETTGLAKPSPVIETFNSDELVAQHIKLDGVVTMVDCKHAMQHLNEVKARWVVNEAVEQIAYADRIILNKTDLVNEADLLELTQKIKKINGLAQITQTNYGAVDMDFVLGVGGYDLDRIESAVDGNSEHCTDGHDHHRGHHHDHIHDSAVKSVSIVSEGTMDLDEVNDWLETLVAEKGEDLYRMKGIVSVNESTGRYVFQGVHSMLDGCPAKPWGPDEKRVNKLVFIGRNLNETALRKAFKGCLV